MWIQSKLDQKVCDFHPSTRSSVIMIRRRRRTRGRVRQGPEAIRHIWKGCILRTQWLRGLGRWLRSERVRMVIVRHAQRW